MDLARHLHELPRPSHRPGTQDAIDHGRVFPAQFVFTTSGVEDPLALDYSIKRMGIDNVLWAIDYPYQPMKPAVDFLDSAPLSAVELPKLSHENAERIFHIAPVARVATAS